MVLVSDFGACIIQNKWIEYLLLGFQFELICMVSGILIFLILIWLPWLGLVANSFSCQVHCCLQIRPFDLKNLIWEASFGSLYVVNVQRAEEVCRLLIGWVIKKNYPLPNSFNCTSIFIFVPQLLNEKIVSSSRLCSME